MKRALTIAAAFLICASGAAAQDRDKKDKKDKDRPAAAQPAPRAVQPQQQVPRVQPQPRPQPQQQQAPRFQPQQQPRVQPQQQIQRPDRPARADRPAAAPANPFGAAAPRQRPDRPDRPARPDRPDRPDRADQPAANPYGAAAPRPDRPARPDRPDRPARPDRPDRPAIGPRPDRSDAGPRPRPDRPDRPARPDRPDRPDRPAAVDRPDRVDAGPRTRPDRPERPATRPDRPTRGDRPARPERPDRPARPERPDRPARADRPDRPRPSDSRPRSKPSHASLPTKPDRKAKPNRSASPEAMAHSRKVRQELRGERNKTYSYRGKTLKAARVRPYRYPSNWRYRAWRRHDRFPVELFLSDFFLNNYYSYGLSAPSRGYMWVRYGPDAVLVDRDSYDIIDVAYGVFDDGSGYDAGSGDDSNLPAIDESLPREFATGELDLTAGMDQSDACDFFYNDRQTQDDIDAAWDDQDWNSLAKTVIWAGCGNDVSYFLLGLAAEGLVLNDAAGAYYGRAIELADGDGDSTFRCADWSDDACRGMNIGNEASDGLDRIYGPATN